MYNTKKKSFLVGGFRHFSLTKLVLLKGTHSLLFSNLIETIATIIFHPLVMRKVGENHLNIFNNSFCCGEMEVDMPEDDTSKWKVVENILEDYSQYLQIILLMSWLVKDNAITLSDLFFICIDAEEVTSKTRLTVYSDAAGLFSNTTLSDQELVQSFNYFEKFLKGTGVKPETHPLSQIPDDPNIAITSKRNFYNYNNQNRVDRVFTQLHLARSNSYLPLKISFYIATLEALFNIEQKKASHNVSNRAAALIGGNEYTRNENYRLIKSAYNVRSDFLHGRTFKISNYDEMSRYSIKIDNCLRTILRKVLDCAETFLLPDKELKKYLDELTETFPSGIG